MIRYVYKHKSIYIYIYLVQVYQTHGYCIVLLSNVHDRERHSMRACETQKTMGLETGLWDNG